MYSSHSGLAVRCLCAKWGTLTSPRRRNTSPLQTGQIYVPKRVALDAWISSPVRLLIANSMAARPFVFAIEFKRRYVLLCFRGTPHRGFVTLVNEATGYGPSAETRGGARREE